MRAFLIVIALTAAAALWVGCGGGGDGSSGEGSSTAATTGGEKTTAEGGEASAGEGKGGGGSGGGASGGGGKGGGGSGGGEASGGEGAGGGGQGGNSTGGTNPKAKSGPLTKTEFIAEGDGICNNVTTEYQLKAIELKEEQPKGEEPTQTEVNLKAAVPPLYVAVKEFEALTPPKGKEKEAEAVIAALEDAAKGLEAEPESELTGPKSPFAEFQKLAQQFGFQFCPEL
ncbi:MAG TPA: hypothetical protein VHI77_01690 [Solirubrobacterales bacterium]|jgi:hypothetical protein|nr:hypothetical protein [Solirubrobacterales bacterium]